MIWEVGRIRASDAETEATSRLSWRAKIQTMLPWLKAVVGAYTKRVMRGMAALREEGHAPDGDGDGDGEEWWDRYFDTMYWNR
ncbi:hypothetical protein ACFSE1_06320 [Rhizobium helianthi]|uniref:Uncharacterized protein n=1 Tax=Rhizobium helianthi TaxID=1132695 RepID=A0ABW4M0T6_9HYPH